ncbi:MAG: cobalamin-dependent protein [Desulfobacterales bacterium]|nr:MAG: cobalamin-dependent protein [Desulfobacterales bacterium]
MTFHTAPLNVVLVALYRYQNFPIRIGHSLLENIDGVNPSSIFFKHFYTNAIRYPTAKEENLFKQQIIALNPQIVGFSVYSPYAATAKRLTQIVKESSSAAVVWGGIHPTLFPESCIQEADIVCVGEGEGALADLVTFWRDGKEIQTIENLWLKKNGKIIKNPMRPLIQDLDSIPFPAYARDSFYFIESNQISRKDPVLLNPTLDVLPARGCPFTCSFCVNSLLRPKFHDLGPYTRRRSVANVIEEIKEILDIPGNRKEIIEFHDENFGTQKAWLDGFTTLYPQAVGLPFKVQYNPTLVKAETINQLSKAGLHRVKFGIEAGTDHVRTQVFHRPGKNREILKLAHEVSNSGVKIRYDLILDNPYDTEESLKATIDFVLQLPQPLRFNLYSLQFFPGYPLTRQALEDGHIQAQEASMDRLQKRMARNWGFVPRLFPWTKKQILQNMIWLYAYGLTTDDAVRRAVFQGSPRAKLDLIYLHLKAVVWGKIHAFRRLLYGGKY